MNNKTLLILGLALVVVIASAYTLYQNNKVIEHVVINSYKSDTLGTFLTDENGMTLYVYASNPTAETACDYSCLQFWKPFIVDLSYGGDDGFLKKNYNLGDKVSIIERGDGLYQYAYEGKLLYRFFGDKKPGDVFGLDVFEKKWVLIKL